MPGDGNGRLPGLAEPADTTHEPQGLARWTDLHRAIAALPDAEREAFDLLWYHELPQAEAAALLGISERTLQRRWRSARCRLGAAWLGDRSPDRGRGGSVDVRRDQA